MTGIAVRWEDTDTGIAHVVLDDPDAKVNTLNDAYARGMDVVLDRLESHDDSLVGVVLRSAKSSFFAGGDLNRLLAVEPADRDAFVADVDVRKHRLHRLENSGIPVVAILDGAALGGGLELALACHHRIAVRSKRLLVGFPETALGLMPGAGGVVRSSLMIGDAALDLITTARRLDADEALDLGLVDEVVDTADEALDRAEAWLRTASRPAVQRWRTHPAGLHVRAPRTEHSHRLVADVAALAATGDIAAAMHAESAALGELVVDPGTKNTIRVNFHDLTDFRRAASRRAAETTGVPVTFVGRTDAAHRVLAGRAAWEYVDGRDGREITRTAGTVEVTAAETLAAGQARLHPDVVGDCLTFLEVALEPGGPADELGTSLAGLLRHGLGVVEVVPGPAPSAVLRRTAEQAGDDALLAVATEAVALAEIHPGLRDALDLASVRFGAVPTSTGGARRYLAAHTL